MSEGPKDVGVVAAEIYFPPYYVKQSDLEEHDKVSAGKYTEGLMQEELAFCMDDEDVNSLCLTVVDRLMANHRINPSHVGRIEVGSESHVDRAKSIKSFLMRLFPNSNISGGDHLGACFGGTAALFSAVAWMQSSMWDGRYCIVVAGDIAVYDEGAARPTGGAAAVALLIGPNAKVVLDTNISPCYSSSDVYDFFKANMASEYPTVDGRLSIDSYMNTLIRCFKSLDINVPIHYLVLHTPFSKLAIKAANVLESLKPESLTSAMVQPSLFLTKHIGNMYCASIFAGLFSVLLTSTVDCARNVLMFSYGSGSQGALFSIKLLPGCDSILNKQSLLESLSARVKCTPELFTATVNSRSRLFLEKSWTASNKCRRQDKVWYLTRVDALHRRFYEKLE